MPCCGDGVLGSGVANENKPLPVIFDFPDIFFIISPVTNINYRDCLIFKEFHEQSEV